MSAPIPLRELDGELTTQDWGDGLRLTVVFFECPNPKCARGHSQAIAYSDAKHHRIPMPPKHGEGTIGIWQRVSGETIDTITLAPSVVVKICDGLHGYIRGGAWVWC